jgi:hypothetical protein
VVKVQLRDASDRDKVLVKELFLPWIPQDQREVRIRNTVHSARYESYRVVDHVYDIGLDDPGASEVLIFVTPVKT